MERWQPIKGKTFCYARFRKNEEAINDFFWHVEGILNDVDARSKAAPDADYLSSILDYGLDQGNRKDTFNKDFKIIHPRIVNTFRQFSLIACASYFELYLSQSFRLSLYSNVGIMFKQSQSLDGIKVLKAKELFPFQSTLKSLIEGKWKDRYKRIKEVFGVSIPSIEKNIVRLEDHRIKRNAIAHQFGLEGDLRFFERVDPSYFKATTISVTSDDIKESFKIMREVVDDIESQITSSNVGVFEYLVFIHNYKNDVDNFKAKMPTRYAKFSVEKMLNAFSSENGLDRITRGDARALITYYNNS